MEEKRKILREDTIGPVYGRGMRVFHTDDKVQYLEGGNVIVKYIGDDGLEHAQELTNGEFQGLLDVSGQLGK